MKNNNPRRHPHQIRLFTFLFGLLIIVHWSRAEMQVKVIPSVAVPGDLILQCNLVVTDHGDPLAETWQALREDEILATATTFSELHDRLEAPETFLLRYHTRNQNGDLLARKTTRILLKSSPRPGGAGSVLPTTPQGRCSFWTGQSPLLQR